MDINENENEKKTAAQQAGRPTKDIFKQLDEIHAIKDYDETICRKIDCDEFSREVKEAQEYAAEHGIDMKKDFSAISDSLATKIMQCCKMVAREPRFADLTWALEDDCISTGCLYCMKYGVKNYNAEKCFGRIIPYFKQVVRSGFYRVLKKWMKEKQLEEEAKEAVMGSLSAQQ